MSMETINERIDFVIKAKAGGRPGFAKLIGVSQQYVNKIANPGGSVGLEPVLTILRLYPDIDARWLLLGEGEPYVVPETVRDFRRRIGGRIDYLLAVEKYLPVMDPEEIEDLESIIGGGYPDPSRIPFWEVKLEERNRALAERVQKAMEVGVCKTRSDKK